ncbi:MAG: hypothetical protein ABIS07_02780 [Dokdonella sp.]
MKKIALRIAIACIIAAAATTSWHAMRRHTPSLLVFPSQSGLRAVSMSATQFIFAMSA